MKEVIMNQEKELLSNLFIENLILNEFDEDTAKEETIKQQMINKLNKLQDDENALAIKEKREPHYVTSAYFKRYVDWVIQNNGELNIITLNLYHSTQVKQTIDNYYKFLVASYELAKYLKAKEK
ncbi:hypothetical protein ONA24_03450 [Mycoplasmopsis cynos]|uniref:hypothetical protein n=2 Tax=Mycoplasmopsis cynos TaxID=171284 RepID=UPI002205FEB0|nr:hypothetical protein [Mycoplasmopsis cynos]MCU9936616.1 hypothetical protein [Mycoplasmopsis cynos]UWV82398.1 hypothetical protein NW067_05395 [Mycoplasmopsis cynos]UWV93660.1 hypothetical protein NW062_07205 [Mycoplasmopsis cynos]WAM04025.1 hypothetical protein ONA22_03520 [Mycoplasmopsis cynos]WAM06165.1 hypothetical protein ONA23_03960 [Mycoplasmopsis cynos]